MVIPKGWLSQDRLAPRRVALRVITNSKLATNLLGEFNELATLPQGRRSPRWIDPGKIVAQAWRRS
jgi:hypothetical protein